MQNDNSVLLHADRPKSKVIMPVNATSGHHGFSLPTRNTKTMKDAIYRGMPLPIFAVNDEAGFAIFDAVTQIKRSGIYRHRVKYLTNRAAAAFDSYEKMRRGAFYTKTIETIHYDLYDTFHEDVKKHIFTLRMSVYNVLTRLQAVDREMFSYVITADAVLSLAKSVVLKHVEKVKTLFGVDLAEEKDYNNETRFFSLAGLRKTWRELVNTIVPNDVFREVMRDKDFRLACEIIAKQLLSYELYEKISAEMIKKHYKEMLAEATTEEQRKEITEHYNQINNQQ